jgi:hypothetical protein
MDKKEALLLCSEHWEYLSKIPMKEKFTIWKVSYGPAKEWFNHCACCEYMRSNGIETYQESCREYCPMISVWEGEGDGHNAIIDEELPCEYPPSPYNTLLTAITKNELSEEECTRLCQIIAEGAAKLVAECDETTEEK